MFVSDNVRCVECPVTPCPMMQYVQIHTPQNAANASTKLVVSFLTTLLNGWDGLAVVVAGWLSVGLRMVDGRSGTEGSSLIVVEVRWCWREDTGWQHLIQGHRHAVVTRRGEEAIAGHSDLLVRSSKHVGLHAMVVVSDGGRWSHVHCVSASGSRVGMIVALMSATTVITSVAVERLSMFKARTIAVVCGDFLATDIQLHSGDGKAGGLASRVLFWLDAQLLFTKVPLKRERLALI